MHYVAPSRLLLLFASLWLICVNTLLQHQQRQHHSAANLRVVRTWSSPIDLARSNAVNKETQTRNSTYAGKPYRRRPVSNIATTAGTIKLSSSLKRINDELCGFFSTKGLHGEQLKSKLRMFMLQHDNELDGVHAAILMHRCALNNIVVTDIVPINYLVQLCSKTTRFNAFHLSQLLYGFKLLSTTTPDVHRLLNVVTDHVEACTDAFEGSIVAKALYGLQRFSTLTAISITNSVTSSAPTRMAIAPNDVCDSVEALLLALTRKIDTSQGPLNGQEISNAVFGKQYLYSAPSCYAVNSLTVDLELRRH